MDDLNSSYGLVSDVAITIRQSSMDQQATSLSCLFVFSLICLPCLNRSRKGTNGYISGVPFSDCRVFPLCKTLGFVQPPRPSSILDRLPDLQNIRYI